MIEKEDLEAVVVASVTAVHAEQTLKAIKKGYHVLCEKPLSTNVETVSNFEVSPIRDAYACTNDKYLP